MRVWHVLTVRGAVRSLHAQGEGWEGAPWRTTCRRSHQKKNMDEARPVVALR